MNEDRDRDQGRPDSDDDNDPSDGDQATMPPVATIGDEPDEYVDTDTGKIIRTPKPCCGCRAIDHRFSLEMDEESCKVYREARYCNLSYTFISSWCMMLLFATIASAGIIAIGFLDPKLLQYQIVGIVLTIIFGSVLPVFFVFWICLQKRAREIRRKYRAERNRIQVFDEDQEDPKKDKGKNKDDDDDTDDDNDDDSDLDSDEEALAKPAEYIPPPGPPASSREDLRRLVENKQEE